MTDRITVTVSRKVNLGNYENALLSCTLEREVTKDDVKNRVEKHMFLQAMEDVEEQIGHVRANKDVEKIKGGSS